MFHFQWGSVNSTPGEVRYVSLPVKPAVDLVTVRSTFALSSSFSVGLMRVPAVPGCHKRGENFQKYLLWGPASLSEHEASHLYWQARPQHAFSTHASQAVTGTQVVYGKRQPHPRPGYSMFNQFQSMFTQCSINVQSMFNDMLCELPFVRTWSHKR